ncbi:MAG: esterase-like activity of phytase family protein [Bacteroidota bacterium]
MIRLFLALSFLSLVLFACEPSTQPKNQEERPHIEGPFPKAYPLQGLSATLVRDSLAVSGGYGSDIYPHPSMPFAYYLLTDRGPNYDYETPDGSEAKGFAIPDYAPRIGLFQLQDDSLKLIRTILLKNKEGKAITGLPNLPGKGGTNEAAYGLDGSIIPNDPEGIDPEGLVALEDGSFWVSDEYGPYIMHFDSNGVLLEKISPFDSSSSGKILPAVFSKRRPNRGMEGLTICPDQTTLVGIMQSAMYNPDNSVKKNSAVSRILTLNLTTGATQQFVYLQQAPSIANSAICAIDTHRFLIIERDGLYPPPTGRGTEKHRAQYSQLKSIVEVTLEGATDISDPENKPNGLMIDSLTIEQLKDAEGLEKAGIVPVKKRVIFSLLDEQLHYPHDKVEGLFYLAQDTVLGIVNDNDFSIDSDGKRLFAKRTLSGEVDQTVLYYFKLPNPPKPAQ